MRLTLYKSACKAVKEFKTNNADTKIGTDPVPKSNFRINLEKENIRDTSISSELHYYLERQTDDTSGSAITQSINSIKKRWPSIESNSTETPLFILSAGFRSGSTLLQRMLLKHSMLWGEPYGTSGLLDHLIAPFMHLDQQWPPDSFFLDKNQPKNYQQKWIANLYPEPEHLMTAAQHYLEALFKIPANNQGYSNWGFKEVRLDGEHASFLKWLYPDSHFLLLIRNPYDAYKSYRKYPKPWYIRSPDILMDSVEKFASHWLNCCQSFLQHRSSLKAITIHYEQIINPDFDWTEIESYLGLSVDKSALQHKIDGLSNLAGVSINIDTELEQLEKLVSPLATQLGYARV